MDVKRVAANSRGVSIHVPSNKLREEALNVNGSTGNFNRGRVVWISGA